MLKECLLGEGPSPLCRTPGLEIARYPRLACICKTHTALVSWGLQVINNGNKPRREILLKKVKVSSSQVTSIEMVKWNILLVNVLKTSKHPRDFFLDCHPWDAHHCGEAREGGGKTCYVGGMLGGLCVCAGHLTQCRAEKTNWRCSACLHGGRSTHRKLEAAAETATGDSGAQGLPSTEDTWAEAWVGSLLCSPGVSEVWRFLKKWDERWYSPLRLFNSTSVKVAFRISQREWIVQGMALALLIKHRKK